MSPFFHHGGHEAEARPEPRADYEKMGITHIEGGRHGEVSTTHDERVAAITAALETLEHPGDSATFTSAAHPFGAVKLSRAADGSVAALAAARNATGAVIAEMRTYGFGEPDHDGVAEAFRLHWPEFEIPQLVEHLMVGLLGLPFDFPLTVETSS